jgi:two-component system CheB/CheR fusion protein
MITFNGRRRLENSESLSENVNQRADGAADLAHFEEVLEYLHQTRGFDFTAYKRATLIRRVSKRMQTIGVGTFEAYLDYLQVHPDEFDGLFNTILINVTSFFRDPEVWAEVGERLIPELLEQRPDGVIRAWSAGCAGGHEPYTVAMLFAEKIGAEALKDRVKIYATDVDDEALGQARAGLYPDRQMADVPPALADKYFDRHGSDYTVSRELRRAVIFGRNDLIQDAPISRLDLLLCRNTLMYFQTEAQSRILARFYFSLNPRGYLLLGRAEMLFSHAATFAAADLKRRIFRAVPKPNQRDRLLLLAQTGRETMPDKSSDKPSGLSRVREAAFESDRLPQILLDLNGVLVAVNAPARLLFGLSPHDIGRPLQDLEISYRPAELRGVITRVIQERREVVLKDVLWPQRGEMRYLEIVVSPLFDEHSMIGTRVSFRDVTEVRSLQNALQHSKHELETAYEELQSTNEELETTNEELQSTVEELETTNEELQSTNEELETMNEELQSTNEELQTMNDELRNRSTDLNSVNSFLESVFSSIHSAVVVLDRDFVVQVWNQRATDLWGLRSEEAHGSHFLGLDIGLPVADLRQPIREALSGGDNHHEVVLPATNRRGRPIQCRVSVAPLRQADNSIRGVLLLMEDVEIEDPARA